MTTEALRKAIYETDGIVLQFIEDSKKLIRHIDESNDPKFAEIKRNLVDFLKDAELIDSEDIKPDAFS